MKGFFIPRQEGMGVRMKEEEIAKKEGMEKSDARSWEAFQSSGWSDKACRRTKKKRKKQTKQDQICFLLQSGRKKAVRAARDNREEVGREKWEEDVDVWADL